MGRAGVLREGQDSCHESQAVARASRSSRLPPHLSHPPHAWPVLGCPSRHRPMPCLPALVSQGP